MRNLLAEEARERMLALARPLPAEDVSLLEADGRFLGELVDATRDQPPFPASAVDGYASRVCDA